MHRAQYHLEAAQDRCDPERWRQIESAYRQATARPELDRPAFLREACAGDGAPGSRDGRAAHEGSTSVRGRQRPALTIPFRRTRRRHTCGTVLADTA
jgi:hypothetical protein